MTLSKITRWFKRWCVEREYQSVLIDLMAVRDHLMVLEDVYQEHYHAELVQEILDYRCRIAELTDELNGIASRKRLYDNQN